MSIRQIFSYWKQLSPIRRWTILLLSAILIYTLFGFLLLPKIIRSQLEEKLSAALNRPTSVTQVKINPYTLEATINGFQVLELNETKPFLSFNNLHVNIHIASIFKRALIIQNCFLDSPYLNLSRNKDMTYNFSDLLQTEPKKEKEPGKPFLFSINNIVITRGAIEFDDRPEEASHSIIDMGLAVPFISNLPYQLETFVKPAFSANINGTPFELDGASRPFIDSRETEFQINFKGINIIDYLAYLPEGLNFSITKAHLDIGLAVSFQQNPHEKPSINFRGKLSLNDVELIDGSHENLLSFPELSIDIDSSDIFRKELHLSKIYFRQPQITVTKLEGGELNLTNLIIDNQETTPSENKPESKGKPFLLTLDTLIVDNGTLFFADQSISTPFHTTLQPIDLQVNAINTAVGSRPADYELHLTSESKENITLHGALSLTPLHVNGSLEFQNWQIEKYRPYYADIFPGQLNTEKMNCAVSFDYGSEKTELHFTEAGLEIEELTLRGPDPADTITIGTFSFSDGTVNLNDKTVNIEQCSTSGGTIPVARLKDGTLNLHSFLAPESSEQKTEATKDTASENENSWELTINNLKLSEFTIPVTDFGPEQEFRADFDQIHLTAENITTKENDKGMYHITMRVNEKGNIDASGLTTLSPFESSIDLKLQKIPLAMVQPYLDQHLNLILKEGKLDITGKIQVKTDTQQKPVAHFQGDISIPDLSTLDSQLAQDLLAWQNLSLRAFSLSTPPLQISTDEIALDAVHINSIIDSNGKLNLASLVKEKPKGDNGESSQEDTKEPEEKTDIKIGTISIVNSRFDFRDHSISPTFKTSLDKFNGTITGLTSGEDKPGDIDFTGVLDNYAPIQITGKIQPWQNFFTDINIDFKDIDLSPMSPYTMKYIGYPLNKGKLTLDLHYLIDGKKLKSKNTAYINQITLGDFVDNDTATSLPVSLAISLLKNRAGEIHLDIPVSGELDDPEFSVAGVVFKIITNLIIKSATSPFALLGALIPDFEELQYVQFVPGSNVIIEENIQALTSLAQALYDRPGLSIELTGHVATKEDSNTMLENRFSETLMAEKRKELIKKGTVAPETEAIDSQEDYEHYLLKAYKSAPFEKPENFLGILKKQPQEEMERMLYEHLAVTENDLRLLAISRATAVKTFLIENGNVEAERIFLIEPKLAATQSQDITNMRVDMKLK